MKIIAIRHGETEWNFQKRTMGQLDSPLTALGLKQAQAIAQRMSKEVFSVFYTSDLKRAKDTSKFIEDASLITPKQHKGLRERNFGIFEGLTMEERLAKFPVEQADLLSIGYEFQIPQGESASQFRKRVVQTMTQIAEQHSDSKVVIVSHGGFLMSFFEYLLGLPYGNADRFKRYNASYNVFEFSEGLWTLETWNDVSHLSHLSTLDDHDKL